LLGCEKAKIVGRRRVDRYNFRMSFEKLAEKKIQEAMESGEFDNLDGKGTPIDLTAYFATPADVRLGYSVLKNAGVIPPEAELLKEIDELRDKAAACTTEVECLKLKKEIEAKVLKLNLILERYKRR
jgi:hypothetical protein